MYYDDHAMKKYWFRAKRYGWGWYPVTWQGWLVTAIFITLEYLNFLRIDAGSHSASDTMRPFLVETFLMALVFIYIGYKTGEPPRWRWGEKSDRGQE